jgi:hypothetical protein
MPGQIHCGDNHAMLGVFLEIGNGRGGAARWIRPVVSGQGAAGVPDARNIMVTAGGNAQPVISRPGGHQRRVITRIGKQDQLGPFVSQHPYGAGGWSNGVPFLGVGEGFVLVSAGSNVWTNTWTQSP